MKVFQNHGPFECILVANWMKTTRNHWKIAETNSLWYKCPIKQFTLLSAACPSLVTANVFSVVHVHFSATEVFWHSGALQTGLLLLLLCNNAMANLQASYTARYCQILRRPCFAETTDRTLWKSPAVHIHIINNTARCRPTTSLLWALSAINHYDFGDTERQNQLV